MKCFEIILGALEYKTEQSQASSELQWSAHVIASRNCVCDTRMMKNHYTTRQKGHFRGRRQGSFQRKGKSCYCEIIKKKKSKEAPRSALIVAEENGSERKKKSV